MDWTTLDHRYMAEALRQAEFGLFSTDPNPRVGCVLVKSDQILASGWHRRAGEGHAEVNALAEAGDRARGATVYVTLEPCSHQGKTGPCAEALVDAGVAEVVIAMQDPNPQVAGRGIALLERAGIVVRSGLMKAQAAALNPGFVCRMEKQRPFVRIKLAMSLDGRTAMHSGESKWITGAAAREDVQRLRARSSVILTGSGTVEYDNPALTVRLDPALYPDNHVRQPKRAVLDWQSRLTGKEQIFQATADVLYFSTLSGGHQLFGDHVEVIRHDSGRGPLDWILKALAERECNELLVESGATLAGAFIAQQCWDELVVYIAPKLMGSRARPLLELPLDSMNQSHGLKLTDIRLLGDDLRLTYIPS